MAPWILVAILAVSGAVSLGLLYNSLIVLPREMHRVYRETLLSLALLVESKQPSAKGHCERVADLSLRIGRAIRLSMADQHILEYAALMHDVGKVGVRADVLNKEGPLTPEEQQELQLHTLHSAAILDEISGEGLREMAELVGWHETPWEEVATGARLKRLVGVLAVAEAWDTLTHGRAYEAPLSAEEAKGRLLRGVGTLYCEEAVEALFAVTGIPGLLPELERVGGLA
ncbi:MAG TPA: HD domain-containing phosphohydrolase [Armatimonadota bacterium]|jgi:HD-GYP domain-containing protein (c-di-GMP phosphodiesterase class II)